MVERSSIRSAISGTVVGNFMEWFDFGVYGYVTVTLSQLFFQTGDEQLDVLLALLGFAVSVVVRPLGGLVLGPLGDRIGRQTVLFFATALIGVLPTHAQIGFPAAILLYVLKMVQGFSTGGEYAGAATYVSEFSSDRKRGYYASWLDIGSYLGFATGAGTVALVHAIASAGWGESVHGPGLARAVPRRDPAGRGRDLLPRPHPRDPGVRERRAGRGCGARGDRRR